MLTRTRKRSARITLVLLGAAALSSCDDQSERRDVYASRQDCVQDWGEEKKCEPAPDSAAPSGRTHSGGGYFWGPLYSGHNYRYGSGSGSSALSSARTGSRAISSTSSSISRGGFGSSSSSHSSGS